MSLTVKSRLEGAGKTIIDDLVGKIIGDKFYIELSDDNQVLGQIKK